MSKAFNLLNPQKLGVCVRNFTQIHYFTLFNFCLENNSYYLGYFSKILSHNYTVALNLEAFDWFCGMSASTHLNNVIGIFS